MPYSAEITAPSDLTVLMSAVPQGDPQPVSNGKRVHKFLQKIPIQSYLIAIAAGNIGNLRIFTWKTVKFQKVKIFRQIAMFVLILLSNQRTFTRKVRNIVFLKKTFFHSSRLKSIVTDASKFQSRVKMIFKIDSSLL